MTTQAQYLQPGYVFCWEGIDVVVSKPPTDYNDSVLVEFTDGNDELLPSDLELEVIAIVPITSSFEVGTCYRHVSGRVMQVVGSAFTKANGACLVVEDSSADGISPLSTDADTTGWQPISQAEYDEDWADIYQHMDAAAKTWSQIDG